MEDLPTLWCILPERGRDFVHKFGALNFTDTNQNELRRGSQSAGAAGVLARDLTASNLHITTEEQLTCLRGYLGT